jgi:6,7-dimethyl-8-ribityllumazine synthase
MAHAPQSDGSFPRVRVEGARLLIIESRYYERIAEPLLAGALAELAASGATADRILVPGALEIPQALAQAAKAGLIPRSAARGKYDGCVALGCVVRGETSHYETVCNNANHWLMDLAVRHAIPLGNAILTVETEEQALARTGKGVDAVRACLALFEHARRFSKDTA